jgi:hypothetical protein
MRMENAAALAADGRYTEAKAAAENLLRHDPADAAALVLLGKIEYYLGHDGASRRAFELALTQTPDDFAAYLGLQFFRERRLKRFGVGLLAAAVIALCAGGTFLYNRQAAADAAALQTLSALINEKNSRLEEKLAAVTAAQARQTEKSARLEKLLKDFLEKERQRDAAAYERLKKDIEALRDAMLKKPE